VKKTHVLILSLALSGLAVQVQAQPRQGHRRPPAAQAQRPNLSAEQKAQLQTLDEATHQQLEAIRAQVQAGTLSRQAAHEQTKAVMEEHRASVKIILTPEQLQALERAGGPMGPGGPRGFGGPGGSRGREDAGFGGPGPKMPPLPEAIAEQLGLSDEQQTQLQKVMDQHRTELEAARASGQRPTRQQLDALRQDIEALLAPPQRQKLKELRQHDPGLGPEIGDAGGSGSAAAKPTTDEPENQSWGNIKAQDH